MAGEVPPDILPDVVLLDGRLVEPEKALVSAFDRGLLFGESVFETLKVVGGEPCLWSAHSIRLGAACAELGFPIRLQEIEAGVRALLRERPVGRGALRIQVTGGVQPGGGRGMTAPREGRRPRVVARVDGVTGFEERWYERGVGVITAADLHRPLPWLKSGSYLASVAAKARAEEAGAFECLLMGGEPPGLTEGSFSNLLLWDGEALVSPPAGHRLPGVTVGVVVEEARVMGITTEERRVTVQEAREGVILLTGSLVGVCRCVSLDGRPLVGAGEPSARLRKALEQREATSREHWRVG